MNNFHCARPQSHATVPTSPICGAGAENTVIDNEVYTATSSAVSLRPKYMVLDVKVLPTRKGGSMALSMFSPPSRPFCASEKRPEWFFKSHNGDQTMTTVKTTTTPTPGNLSTGHAPQFTPPQTAFGQMLRLRVKGSLRPPLPVDPLARHQSIENALSMALWHVRHDTGTDAIQAATGRAIRAASMLKQACTEATNGGRA